MKVVVTRTSDWNLRVIKEFSTIDELFKFMRECRHPLILNTNSDKGYCISDIVKYHGVTSEVAEQISECDYAIEIYDTWRE